MGTELNPTDIPRIAPMFRFQWEQAQDCYVILYPEGMVNLSSSAGEILKRCDGERTIEAILTDLKEAFPGADIEDDVYKFLGTAYDNGWLVSAK